MIHTRVHVLACVCVVCPPRKAVSCLHCAEVLHLHAHQHSQWSLLTQCAGLKSLSRDPWHVLIFISFSEKIQDPRVQGSSSRQLPLFLFVQINSLSHLWSHLYLSNITHAIHQKILLVCLWNIFSSTHFYSFHHDHWPSWSGYHRPLSWVIAKPHLPNLTLALP